MASSRTEQSLWTLLDGMCSIWQIYVLRNASLVDSLLCLYCVLSLWDYYNFQLYTQNICYHDLLFEFIVKHIGSDKYNATAL